jgi:hypothetical protein
VTHGDGIEANERFVSRTDQVPLDGSPTERIGTVENDYRDTGLGAGLEGERGRPDKSVHPCSDILEIDYERVDFTKHFRSWSACFGVETEERDTQNGVGLVGRLDHVVLFLTGDAMLGSKECSKPAATECVKDIT